MLSSITFSYVLFEFQGALISATKLLCPDGLLRDIPTVRVKILRIVQLRQRARQGYVLALGNHVLRHPGILPEPLYDILGLRVIDLLHHLLKAGLHVGDKSVELLDPMILLLTHEMQVCPLILCLLQLCLECSVPGLQLLLKLDNLQMQLIVFLDHSFILLLQWLIVQVVIRDLRLQTLIDLFKLLEPLRRLQQVIQELLGQCRTLKSYTRIIISFSCLLKGWQ